ncbi:ATP-binding protein [Brevundimonas sp. SORGH_AS_0993]|uniref:ATP-binding protein n=1 Tax=Brevundimonas sp. SORGH_AS_0993 TaxID=3041794 RepID=UPI00277F1A82|nr:ATP-binding protein [Brevundimonas sp. SORGH_AS_0993]MDQ1155269.1 signal transduction histidine kinase/ActR/RegA family two-component response regulator [Brevundimonas sp. SORGH_AS_0993]
MPLIGDFVDLIAPVAPTASGAEVFERFQAEPNTLALAVVADDGRPLGLIERNAFTLRMAAEFGRALYARKPADSLMDRNAPVAEAATSAETFFHAYGTAELGALLGGFIVVSEGRYIGVGTALQVVQAGAALHRQRAEEMGALARDLAAAEAEAVASSRAKSEFLAVMSHEIRTPLNGVLGVAALMDRKLEQQELRPYVRTIIDSGQSLLRLLTDALDMSRASAGMLTLEEEPLDLAAVAFDIDALWRARAEEKGLALRVEPRLAAPWVQADGMRLKQLLNNLIGNALKFTTQGEVVARIESRADGQVVLTIDDSGPGVPEAAAAGIFDPFNTGKAGREGAGAGLGLAICRQIAERMGGAIGLSTSPQGGARFQVRLPLRPAASPTAVATPPAPPTPHDTLHVLVVDDNVTNRFVAARVLEMFGCTLETAENGRQALEAVAARPFDLVLMDINMPVMDGIAATRAIRALSGPAAHLPILALTANADEHDALDYRAAGMDGVAQKPIQPDALLNAIRQIMTAAAAEAASAPCAA